MSILSQGADTVNKKLSAFTYVYIFATEAQETQKIRTVSLNLRILLVLT